MLMAMMHNTSANLDDLDNFPRNHNHQIMSENQEQQNSIIIKSTCPISWKLYQNPFFIPTNPTITNFTSNNNTDFNLIINNDSNNNPFKLKPKQLQRKYSASAKFLHNSDLKMSNTKTQIAELKAELEMERALRKRMQALNKKLSKELIDQSQRKQMCVVCDDLMKEITRLKEETQKMKAEMDEERKMLRMAEVLREERVQMKLADAQLFYHQEFLNNFLLQQPQIKQSSKETGSSFEQNGCSKNGGNVQRKAAVSSLSSSPETENPHIKQGIKGFVEFQRAIKAKNNGCNANNNGTNNANYYCNKQLRDLGGFSNKVECQKAQLRVLFKHKCSVPYSSHHDHNLILS
ncbi:protein BRANCHLESS TRICHOME-like [Chenopodium quinoa]|uniref:protein BRANCHLESS TRICHOME-like n=1 Tax=Chenopodium quinoa TaxID=63459 RepID=UPI000B79075E|nr:protein BRANCHLESS TRICHOME-like [Chenopodium quinoa]